MNIAYFITPHGFGHAARAAAVMAAVYQTVPSIRFEIFTTVPQWFFEQSLIGPFAYHSTLTDIGLVQRDALHEDPRATAQRLGEFFPFNPNLVTRLVQEVEKTSCELVLCDIAPLGIAVAQQAGIPSILVENFTWDWIYEGYLEEEPRLREHIGFLWHMFGMVDYRIQTEPVCSYHPSVLLTSPVSRECRHEKQEVRGQLGIPSEAPAVLITLGGFEARYSFLTQLKARRDCYFIIPGASDIEQHLDNLILLPHHSQFFHPDLINACTAVVGKVGYSTVAEVYRAGLPFGYVPRTRFRESDTLTSFIQSRMKGMELEGEQFEEGRWVNRLDELLVLPRLARNEPNGASQIANYVCNLVGT